MDHTTVVGGVPASRQKNCNACVQAKRRCNRRMPICSRCAEKKIDCVYGKAQATIRSQPRNESNEIAPYMESQQFGSPASLFSPAMLLDVDYLGDIPMDSQPVAATIGSLHPSLIDAASNSDASLDPFTWLLDSSITTNKQQWLAPTDHESIIDLPSSPVNEKTQIAYQKMACFCVSLIQSSFSLATCISLL